MFLKSSLIYFALILLTLTVVVGCGGVSRTPNLFILPANYVGPVKVRYEIAGAPQLPIEEGSRVIRIPAGGTLDTVSSPEDGWAIDSYYRGDVSEKNRLYPDGEADVPPHVKSIWDESISVPDSDKPILSFYVGTETQHNAYLKHHPL